MEESRKDEFIEIHRDVRERFAALLEDDPDGIEDIEQLEKKLASDPEMYGPPFWRITSASLNIYQLQNRIKLYDRAIKILEKEAIEKKEEIINFIENQPNPNIAIMEREVSVEDQQNYNDFLHTLNRLDAEQYNTVIRELKYHPSFYGKLLFNKDRNLSEEISTIILPYIQNRIFILDKLLEYSKSEKTDLKGYLEQFRNDMAKNISDYFSLQQSYENQENENPKKTSKKRSLENGAQAESDNTGKRLDYSSTAVISLPLDTYNEKEMISKKETRIAKARSGGGYIAGNYIPIEEKIEKIKEPFDTSLIKFPPNKVLIKQLEFLQSKNPFSFVSSPDKTPPLPLVSKKTKRSK